MQPLFDFLTAHWDTMVGMAGTFAGVAGWLGERNKRMLDRRDSDMAFYLKTIEAQNEQLERVRTQYDSLEAKFDQINKAHLARIDELTEEVKELSEKLDKYEPDRKKSKPHTIKNA